MHPLAPIILLLSVLAPTRTWYPPTQPLTVDVKVTGDARLVLTDFAGKALAPKGSADLMGEKQVNLRDLWAELATPGTFVLYVVPKGKPLAQFEGTPLVIEARADRRAGAAAEPEVYNVHPLEYAVMTTDKGAMTMVFYFDVAPITSSSFLYLSRTGFYNGLTFHRILPGFVIQGGDPKGDGTGGPGYNIQAEFNDHKHLEGVLSMARSNDPNSAGSQFFVCLDYSSTKQLDQKYTAFGQVVDGMKSAQAIAAVPLVGDPKAGHPQTPPVIQKVEVKPVTSAENPYADMLHVADVK